MSLDDLYREVILEHHREPSCTGPISRVDATSRGHNAACGDDVLINLALEGDTVTEIQVNSKGCAISTAAGSMLAEVVVGMKIDEVRRVIATFRDMLRGQGDGADLPGDLQILEGVRQFAARVKCATLPMTTVLEALVSLSQPPTPR